MKNIAVINFTFNKLFTKSNLKEFQESKIEKIIITRMLVNEEVMPETEFNNNVERVKTFFPFADVEVVNNCFEYQA